MARFSMPAAPAAPQNVYEYGNVRVSVITDRLVRVETKPFTDLPTQKVWRRDLGAVSFSTRQQGAVTEIVTEKCTVAFGADGRLRYVVVGDKKVTDFAKGNLRGTARTLDNSLGAIKLGAGLVSTQGVSVMDDNSLLLKDDDIVQREGDGMDYYVFAYGHDYRGCMRAFYGICGQVPLVPRYALDNWWSRYKAYTQQEYLDVIARFEQEQIPITVATIDMDWHWTDVVKRFGADAKPVAGVNFADKFMSLTMPGWTGYSWNTELFPDYKAMLARLKNSGYHVTLNLHPASGVRYFEDCYQEMCKAMGTDPAAKKPILFRLGDKKFLAAYFDVLHHPYEAEGVDFWWLDWQQGKRSDVPGLDPLWALNHYHYLDSDRGETRPLILSRYAKEGSHRYPLGFSGDTAINWPCLRFQPYFTANAANAGYTWWSHDIGGHHFFCKDDQLYIRWVQFGIFSPIHRLHSSSNEYMGKEPWKCGGDAHRNIARHMRLRHRLIPYIYTANYLSHTQGVALCEPMYYGNPEAPEAYRVPNQYRFGSQLIVAPITDKVDKVSLRAGVEVWLPEGTYTDVFTGAVYQGNQTITMYRDTDSIPVLAKAGAIIPMYRQDKTNDVGNDQPYEIWLYHGDGEFELYEDDGETKAYREGHCAKTAITQRQDGNTLVVHIAPAQGDLAVIPAVRNTTFRFADVVAATARVNGEDVPFEDGKVTVDVTAKDGCEVVLTDCVWRTNLPIKDQVIDIISSYQMNNGAKRRRFGRLAQNPMGKMRARKALRGPIEEVQAMHRDE